MWHLADMAGLATQVDGHLRVSAYVISGGHHGLAGRLILTRGRGQS